MVDNVELLSEARKRRVAHILFILIEEHDEEVSTPGAINMKALRAFYNALSADFAYAVLITHTQCMHYLYKFCIFGNYIFLQYKQISKNYHYQF